MRKRAIRLLLVVIILLAYGAANALDAQGLPGEAAEKDGWHFDEKGFLSGGSNPGPAYLLEDEENGIWQYASRDLSIRIVRFREQYNRQKVREYYVADIWASANSPMKTILTPATKTRPKGVRSVDPEKLVEENPCVFALSDDYFGTRQELLMDGKSNRQPGIIIRNGEILWSKTKKKDSKYGRNRPCLDTLAVYEDGSMGAYVSDEMTAEEYLEKGARQVFSFGPWLIHEGKINEAEATEGCGYYEQMEPLVGLGMVEPYHYIAVVIRGRPEDQYAGAHLSWMADKLMEYGCTEALNLDGGGTALMMFNGKVIVSGQAGSRLRQLGSMIVFGLDPDVVEPGK